MANPGPETRLVAKMRKAGRAKYRARLVIVKYHGDEFTEAGVSDLLCVLDGVFVAIEVKAPESYGGSVERALDKGPSPKQRAFVARVRRAGGIAGFAATIEQFMDLLAQAENTAKPCYNNGSSQTGDTMPSKRGQGLKPGAPPTAPGGMSEKQLVDELLRDTGLTREQAESLSWPQKIEAVVNSRAAIEKRYKEATGEPASFAKAKAYFEDDENAVCVCGEDLKHHTSEHTFVDAVHYFGYNREEFEEIWGTPPPVDEMFEVEKTCWCGGEVGPRAPGDADGLGCLEHLSHDWQDDLSDLDNLLDEAEEARAEYLEKNPPLFLGLPGIADYTLAGHMGAGPSASERWMSCTASLEASRAFLETLTPNQIKAFAQANIAARQGTTAHAAAEVKARHILGLASQDEVDTTLLDLAVSPPDGEEFNDEMEEYISEYLDLVKAYHDTGREVRVEARVSALVPLVGSFEGQVYEVNGSGDAVVLPSKTERTLVVGDLKYGNGIYVEVEENSQARLYALGVLTELADEEGNLPDLDEVIYHIIQPRLGGIRTWSESLDDLLTWRDEVLSPALTKALGGVAEGAEFNPSADACQFCPARSRCSALADQRVAAAAEAFDVVTDAELSNETVDVEGLDNATLALLLDQISGLIDLHKDLKEEAQRRLHRGEEVPGRHLVSYTPKREWKPDAAEKLARVKDVWKEPVLMTPTQALKVLDKGRENAKALVKKYVEVPAKRPVICTGPKDNRAVWVGRDPETMFEKEE